MRFSLVLLLTIVFGAIGLVLGFAVEAPPWRLVLSAVAGMAGGAGIASTLLHIQQLHRQLRC
ncbi:MAG TPA: hypothetical protein VGB77_00980 [Abditibacteriaceae bacterium]|jgi:uncharacterized membrane protein